MFQLSSYCNLKQVIIIMSENTNNDWQEREIAALWLNTNPSGKKYFTGKLTMDVDGTKVTKDVIAFTRKAEDENDNKPNLKVYISKPKGGAASDEDVDL